MAESKGESKSESKGTSKKASESPNEATSELATSASRLLASTRDQLTITIKDQPNAVLEGNIHFLSCRVRQDHLVESLIKSMETHGVHAMVAGPHYAILYAASGSSPPVRHARCTSASSLKSDKSHSPFRELRLDQRASKCAICTL